MQHTQNVSVGGLILALASAVDLTGAHLHHELAYHSHRVAYICHEMAQVLGLPGPEQEALMFAALLHDCGLTRVRSRMEVVLADTGNTAEHCRRGAAFFTSAPLLAGLAPVILSHHDRWAGSNITGLAGRDIPLAARIIHLADRVDVRLDHTGFILGQASSVLAAIRARAGSDFDPDLVDALFDAAESEAFWFRIEEADHAQYLGPLGHNHLSAVELASIAAPFAVIIDDKSPWTHRHSQGVAGVARELAALVGIEETDHVYAAGLLHDLGKLGVPDELLDHPGKLDAGEFMVMKRHAYDTYRLLATVEGLDQLALWAALHHERLDGTGYPFRHRFLPLAARVMAVADVFQALHQQRSYRPALESQDVRRLLLAMATGGALDPDIVDLACSHYRDLATIARDGGRDFVAVGRN
ncbi:MAG: HD domain-containing phosphohydrolase [Bacillota bacterium]